MVDGDPAPMDRRTFQAFRSLILEQSGISLADSKDALLRARVGKRMRTLGLTDLEAYLRVIRRDRTGEELGHLIDAISTNVTSFFRGQDQYDLTRTLVARWLAEGRRQLRFWSAGCSTGEEAYSLAITVLESCGDMAVDTRILATDINNAVLESARAGLFEKQAVETVPPLWRQRYFVIECEGKTRRFRIGEELRRLVHVRRLNLSRPPFPMQGPMDIIYCRNVMIYFDETLRSKLLAEFHRLLRRGGYLMVGHAESLLRSRSLFQSVQPSVYQTRGEEEGSQA